MSEDLNGGAVAPAAPAADAFAGVETPANPIQSSPPPSAEPAKPVAVSAREAAQMAQKQVADKEAATPKGEKPAGEPAKTEAKPAQTAKDAPADTTRGTDGRFVAKEGSKSAEGSSAPAAQVQQAAVPQSEARPARYEAPARFNDAGKAEWAKVPESVQAEVSRMARENEAGIAKYKDAADRYGPLKQFDDIARQHGGDLSKSLAKVVEMENAFKQSPLAGLQKVADWAGFNLQAVAAQFLGQNPNGQLQQAHNEIQQLRAQVAQMERAAQMPAIVEQFAKEHPRFEELSPVIATLIETGTSSDLEAAYKLADVLRPASNAGSPMASEANRLPLTQEESSGAHTAETAPVLPNPNGQKSIHGAPTAGQTPEARKRALSSREAAARAVALTG